MWLVKFVVLLTLIGAVRDAAVHGSITAAAGALACVGALWVTRRVAR